MHKLYRTVILLAVFSIAMGFMESAVVIYLRALYYPHGFNFPLLQVTPQISYVEFFREAATIIMLLIIGILAGRNLAEKFAFFLFCFAVWDIFYYIFLYVILRWPSSLFTWDALFFIPVLWVGPVIAPCIVSLTMIFLTLSVVYLHRHDRMITINRREWILLIAGSLVLINSFTMDFVHYLFQEPRPITASATLGDYLYKSGAYVPSTFHWWVFIFSEALILSGIFSMIWRHRTNAEL